MKLRPVEPIDIEGLAPGLPGEARPELTWIAPSDVGIDDRFQRNLTRRSLALIRKIVAEFDWRRWRPPVCSWTDDGLTAIDGQHSLIAACSHPGIHQVPVMIVDADDLKDRAAAFIGINSSRLAVTTTQMHVAGVVAGDATAVTIQTLCEKVGIRVLKGNPRTSKGFLPGDTVAVGTIGGMIDRIGLELAEIVLKVLADAGCAPVSESRMKATEHLLIDPEFVGQVTPENLVAAIVALREIDDKEAKIFAATHAVPLWRGLASIWFKKARKTRSASKAAAVEPTCSSAPPTFKSVLPDPGRASSRHVVPITGDPPAGRSALDQRKVAS